MPSGRRRSSAARGCAPVRKRGRGGIALSDDDGDNTDCARKTPQAAQGDVDDAAPDDAQDAAAVDASDAVAAQAPKPKSKARMARARTVGRFAHEKNAHAHART